MGSLLMERFRGLPAYVPGAHREGTDVLRLNTNESPYPPSAGVRAAVAAQIDSLQYYNDPDCTALLEALAALHGVSPDQVMAANGSDEVLYFAFMAFADGAHPIVLPDVTYGYYELFAAALGVPLRRVPLKADFSLDSRDYLDAEGMVVIANPNAPTGMAIPPEEVGCIAAANPGRVVLIDEAYVDFGAGSALPLIAQYDNLLIVRTFSKSRSMAGGRLGYALGASTLIAQLSVIRNAVNLYSVGRMTQAAGVAVCREDGYYRENCRRIIAAREYTAQALTARGFEVLPSLGNFVFARCRRMDAATLLAALAARGILVRHFDAPRTREYLRITIGTIEDMHRLVLTLDHILKEVDDHAQCAR